VFFADSFALAAFFAPRGPHGPQPAPVRAREKTRPALALGENHPAFFCWIVGVSFIFALMSCRNRDVRAPASDTTVCPAVPPPPEAAVAPWIWASTVAEPDEAAPCDAQPAKSAPPNEEAREHWRRALEADDAGRLDECIAHDTEGVRLEPSPRAFLHLASCQARSGKTVDALRNADRAYTGARKECDHAAIKVAAKRVRSLLDDAPRVKIAPAQDVDAKSVRTVTVDGATVPLWLTNGEPLLFDAGPHELAFCIDQRGAPSQRSIKLRTEAHAETKVVLSP
jgi:hypothetical protein